MAPRDRPAHRNPADDLLPARYHRKPPSLHQDADIDRLLEAARHLPSPMGLRGLTHATVWGLLMVTGLRISEALALDDADVQRRDAQLMIRRSKCGKSRLVPLHASTLAALTAYAHRRDRVLTRRTTPAFFVSEQGVRLTVLSPTTRLSESRDRSACAHLSTGIGWATVHDERRRVCASVIARLGGGAAHPVNAHGIAKEERGCPITASRCRTCGS